jgi:hypothetical protein
VDTRFRLARGALFVYYAVVLLALLILYGRGDLSTSSFIYQAF